MGEVIALRDLEFVHEHGQKEAVCVSIGKPIFSDDQQQWWCLYEIKANTFAKQFRAGGGDSMQALMLALYIIASELDALGRLHKGKFTYFDEGDLGFPSIEDKRSKY